MEDFLPMDKTAELDTTPRKGFIFPSVYSEYHRAVKSAKDSLWQDPQFVPDKDENDYSVS